jgi:hypothetical protein
MRWWKEKFFYALNLIFWAYFRIIIASIKNILQGKTKKSFNRKIAFLFTPIGAVWMLRKGKIAKKIIGSIRLAIERVS